ncbi:hypothetical protein [Yinghuangia sp. YIM S09857]|uniref:hypothetical protein n=1 Tax=Yinghuangia sp. YIM S09857 TaxID=3436929 RepID=UPI003F52EC60
MNADVNRSRTAVVPQDMIRNPHAPRLVAAGETFDVIEVEDRLGFEALGALYAHRVAVGPVISDRRYRRIGFLVPPATAAPAARQRAVGPRHHGRGAWITVPPADCEDGPLVWLVPPSPEGRLTALHHVRAAIAEAARTLADSRPRAS